MNNAAFILHMEQAAPPPAPAPAASESAVRDVPSCHSGSTCEHKLDYYLRSFLASAWPYAKSYLQGFSQLLLCEMIPSKAVRSHFLRTSLLLQARAASSSSATSAQRSRGNIRHPSPRNTSGASLSGPWSQGNHSNMQLGLQSDHKWGDLDLVTRFHLAFKQLLSCDCASSKKFAAHGFRKSAISCASPNHRGFLVILPGRIS